MRFVAHQIGSPMRNIRTTHSIEYNSREGVDNMNMNLIFQKHWENIWAISVSQVRIGDKYIYF